MAVTQRQTIKIRRTTLRATWLDALAKAHLHGVALSVVAAGSRERAGRIATRPSGSASSHFRRQQTPPEPGW